MLQLLHTCNTLCCSYSCGYHLNFLICVFIRTCVPHRVAWLSPYPSIVGRRVHNVQPHAGIEPTKCSFSLRMKVQSDQNRPLTLKRSVKGGVAEPNDHHKVMNWQNCRSNYVWEYKKPYPLLTAKLLQVRCRTVCIIRNRSIIDRFSIKN